MTSPEGSISCHAQVKQSSLVVTETPRGCQHFHSGAIVAQQQGNNSHKFLRALQDPLARARMQPQNTQSSKQVSTTKPLEEKCTPPSFSPPAAFRDHQKSPGSLCFCAEPENTPSLPHTLPVCILPECPEAKCWEWGLRRDPQQRECDGLKRKRSTHSSENLEGLPQKTRNTHWSSKGRTHSGVCHYCYSRHWDSSHFTKEASNFRWVCSLLLSKRSRKTKWSSL